MGDADIPLSFSAPAQTDTPVTATVPAGDSGILGVHLVRIQDEQAAYLDGLVLSGPFPEVDYATTSVVSYVTSSSARGAGVRITEVTLFGADGLRTGADYEGPSRQPGPPTVAYPMHVPAVPRVSHHIWRGSHSVRDLRRPIR